MAKTKKSVTIKGDEMASDPTREPPLPDQDPHGDVSKTGTNPTVSTPTQPEDPKNKAKKDKKKEESVKKSKKDKDSMKNQPETQPLNPANSQPGADKKAQPGVKPARGHVIAVITTLESVEIRIPVEKKATAGTLFKLACDQLNCSERDFFALSFMEHGVRYWLNAEKTISKQIRNQPWHFKFELKFYPPDPSILDEEFTRYLVCLQVRRDIIDGKLPCSFVTHALLGSYTVQSLMGDWDPQDMGQSFDYIKNIDFAPKNVQNEELLVKIAELHRTHRGLSPADAEQSFLENAKKLAMYGVDLHPAKDKDDCELVLGVCASGLLVYRDKLRINRFAWPKILKISYKRNMFYIKVRPGEFELYDNQVGFKLSSHKMSKRLWKTAVEHHAFFRLRQPEEPAKSGFPRFGSKFHFAGRTLYQSTRGEKQPREHQDFNRIHSQRKFNTTRSMDGGTGFGFTDRSEVYHPDDTMRSATLDLKSRPGRGGSVPHADMEDDDAFYQNQGRGEMGEVNMSTGYDSVGYRRGPPGYNEATPQSPSKDSHGTMSSASGEYPVDQQYDSYGNPIVTQNVTIYATRRGQPGENGLFNSGYDGMRPAGGHPPADHEEASWVWDDENQVWQRTYIKDGEEYIEYRTERDGKVETWIQKRVYIHDEEDHDAALAAAIGAVIDVNPDLSVEKIEIETTKEVHG